VGAVATAAVAGSARADGDPASDFLIAQQVFFPYDVKLPPRQQAELTGTVSAANEAGYKIRVAIIADSYDLGSVTALWRKPRLYARFLGQELSFAYKNRLLVAMPNGFGFNRPGHPATHEYAIVDRIPIGRGAAGLLEAATTAVQRLAAASGVHVTVTDAKGGGSSTSHDRLVIVAAAVAAVLAAAAARLLLRRRRRDPA